MTIKHFLVVLAALTIAGEASRADDDYFKRWKKAAEKQREAAEQAYEFQIKLAKLRQQYALKASKADDAEERYEIAREYQKKVYELQREAAEEAYKNAREYQRRQLKARWEAAERAYELQRKMLKFRRKMKCRDDD